MDTTSEIMMRLLSDLCSGDSNTLKGKYSKYYESLDKSQPKIVVSAAIQKILDENKGKSSCQFGDEDFTLILE